MLRIATATEAQRDEIIHGIFDREVSVNVHFQPLPLLTAYKTRGYKMADYPVAMDMYSNEITLPVYFNLTDENLAQVVAAVKAAVKAVMG
jgi:dTDP-4-amino-4,6-dideoxygalactose transaminase